jgi:hypothetical protein
LAFDLHIGLVHPQLLPNGRLHLRNAFSNNGTGLITHL